MRIKEKIQQTSILIGKIRKEALKPREWKQSKRLEMIKKKRRHFKIKSLRKNVDITVDSF